MGFIRLLVEQDLPVHNPIEDRDLTLPLDLTGACSDDIMNLMVRPTTWAAYFDHEAARATAQAARLVAEYDTEYATQYLLAEGTQKAREASATVYCSKQLLSLEDRRRMLGRLKALSSGCEKKIFVLSREIARRSHKVEF